MRATHLVLSDFRNYHAADVDLAPGANLLLGRNGQGKTNVVEAIAYFSSLRSHRVSSDVPLIRAGADSAVMRLRIQAVDRSTLLELELNRDRANRAQLNRNRVRPREITRWFSSVFFAPEDLAIVRGEPAIRRRFLDDALLARNPAFSAVLADYDRVVRQRTALLRSARASGKRSALETTLEVWDAQLLDLGTQIMLARRSVLSELRTPLWGSYAALAGADHEPNLVIRETAGDDGRDVSRETPGGEEDETLDLPAEVIAARFSASLDRVRAAEFERASTLVGPHRDELFLTLNKLPARGYASHGESWSFALALRLSLALVIRESTLSGDPVLILDDVFAELDADRRERLMTAVGDFEQVIVTAAVADDVPPGVDWHRLHIDAGEVLGGGRP